MTGHPDLAAVIAWSEQVIRDVCYLRAAALGEPTPALSITSTPDLAAAQASPDNPYGSYVSPYTAASPAEVAEGVEPDAAEPFPHIPHLAQHVGRNPMCTLCGMDHYALHAIEQTADGA